MHAHRGSTLTLGEGAERPTIARLRRLLLALVALSIGGLLVELVLLEHYDTPWKWTPLVILVLALVATIMVWLRPTRRAIRLFQGVMLLSMIAGVLGLYLHYRGNVEFEIERDPSLRGLALFWDAIRGATPTLAPGAMTQLGLLGLAFAYRHPILRHSSPVRRAADIHQPETQ